MNYALGGASALSLFPFPVHAGSAATLIRWLAGWPAGWAAHAATVPRDQVTTWLLPKSHACWLHNDNAREKQKSKIASGRMVRGSVQSMYITAHGQRRNSRTFFSSFQPPVCIRCFKNYKYPNLPLNQVVSLTCELICFAFLLIVTNELANGGRRRLSFLSGV